MSKEWEDRYLVLKEENERLKELQRDQASREHKIAQRLAMLKEQQTALQEGRAVAGDAPREAKIAEMQHSIRTLESQHQELVAKLQTHKHPTSTRPASAGAATRKTTVGKGLSLSAAADGPHGATVHNAVAQLKKEILETNLALSKLKEQQASHDLQDSLAHVNTGTHGEVESKEREDLKKDLKTKEARYTLAKTKLESLDKEYKEYVNKHKMLISQAEETQRAIFEQQKQHRMLEAQIKQLKLQKDQESDLKSILEDMREELNLLKEENRKLKEDNFSGQSLVTQSAHYGAEVEKLSSDREELSNLLIQQQERDITLRKKLEEKHALQRRLEKERADKQAQLETLRNTHMELTRNMENFSVHAPASLAAENTRLAQSRQTEGSEGMAWQTEALGRLKQHLVERNYSAKQCFRQWNKAGNGLMVEQETVDGLLETNLGLQKDEARRLFRQMLREPQTNPAEPTISEADFEKLMDEAVAPSAAGASDASSLQAEMRKLRSVNAELLREKDEWIRKLKSRDSSQGSGADGSAANAEARVRALEAEYEAELSRLEAQLAIAELNHKDLQAMRSAAPRRAQIAQSAAQPSRPMRAANAVVVEIHGVSLNSSAFVQEPTTFLSFDFFAHDTQNTYPATGLDLQLGWSCEFVVDVDDVFVNYLQREQLRLDLMERVSQRVPFIKVASCFLRLAPLVDDRPLERQRIELVKDGVGPIGRVEISVRLSQHIGPSILAMREPQRSTTKLAVRHALPAFLAAASAPFRLSITLVKAEKLRAPRYGHVPSPYVQYAFPGDATGEEPYISSTSTGTANPVFNETKVWELAAEAQVSELFSQEMELMVLDDEDTGDDDSGLLGIGRINLGMYIDKEDCGEVRIALKALDGSSAGILVIAMSWLLPLRSVAQAPDKHKLADSQAAPQAAPPSIPQASAPKLAPNVALKEEQRWLQALAEGFARNSQYTLKQIFRNFDHDADGEISWDDFKEAIVNEPLQLTSSQQKQLFEFWAGGITSNITFTVFEKGLKPETASTKELKSDDIGITLRDLTILATSSVLTGTVPSRVCVLVDFFKQPRDQVLASTKAMPVTRKASNAVKVAFDQVLSLSLASRVERTRVLAALEKDKNDGWQNVSILLCAVRDDGSVDADGWLGRGSIDAGPVVKEGKDVRGFALQLVDRYDKPSATLIVDSHLVAAIGSLRSAGVGSLPGAGLREASWLETAASDLVKRLTSKGISLKKAFISMDEDCDGEVNESEFIEAFAHDLNSVDESKRPELFRFISGGKESLNFAVWEASLSKVAGSNIALSSGGEEAKEAIILLIKTLKLKQTLLKDFSKKYKTFSIEVDFFRQPTSQALASTERRDLIADNPVINFNDKVELKVKKDSTEADVKENRQRVLEAIEAGGGKGEVEISLVGRGREGGAGSIEATGRIDVGAIWKEQNDLRDFNLQLVNDAAAPVGALTLDCLAVQALRTLTLTRQATGARQGNVPDPQRTSSSSVQPPAAGSGSFREKPKEEGEGKVWVRVDEVRADELGSDLAGVGWFVSGNFLEQQSEREEARQRSPAFQLQANGTAMPKHTVSFGVSKVRQKANLDALKEALDKDETEGSARVVLTLARQTKGVEYGQLGAIPVAKADCSLADALHARDGDSVVIELPLTYVDGAKKGEDFGTIQVTVCFESVGLLVVDGRNAISAAGREDDECLVVWAEKLDTGSKGATQDRTLRQAGCIALFASAATGTPPPRSRGMLLKDDGGYTKPRPQLTVNHKWVFKGDALDGAMSSGKIKISMQGVGAREEEVASGELDIHSLTNVGKRYHSQTVALQSSKNKVASLQLYVCLPQGVASKTDTAPKKDIADQDKIELSLEVLTLEEDSWILKTSKFQKLMASVYWFGKDVEDHQTQEVKKKSYMTFDQKFTLNLKDKVPDSKEVFHQLMHRALNRGDGLEIVIWGLSDDGQSEDKNDEVAVAKITDKMMMNPEDASVSIKLSPADPSQSDPKGKIKFRIKALEALGTLRFRSNERTVPKFIPDKDLTIVLQEGAKLSKERDKETNIVVCVKSVQITGPLLEGGKAYGNITKVFVAVNFFGSSASLDTVASTGSDAQVVRAVVDVDCRFMCPVDVQYTSNRTALKSAASESLTIDVHLFNEPWTPTQHPLASASFIASSLVEGQYSKLDLKNDGTLLGSVLLQVFYKEALKTIGVKST